MVMRFIDILVDNMNYRKRGSAWFASLLDDPEKNAKTFQ